MLKFSIITAFLDKSRGIGNLGAIPWNIKDDMNYFKNLTTYSPKNKINVVIMGRITYKSLKYPLVSRINVVISKSLYKRRDSLQHLLIYESLTSALSSLDARLYDKIFVIGGEKLYKEAIHHPNCKSIFATQIYNDYEIPVDTYFPQIPEYFLRCRKYGQINIDANSGLPYKFNKYFNNNLHHKRRIYVNSEENNYLQLLNNVWQLGELRQTRNSPVFGMFAPNTLRFNLLDGYPLLTTKKMFYRGIVEELLWFIRGDTNVQNLQDAGVHIWDANAAAFGEVGPIYGHQWRRFNASWPENIGGYDQLKECIRLIREEPTSRRIFMSAWNPQQLHLMCLPPCHVSYQWYVSNNEFLDCAVYCRSQDLFLGTPFNIASAALLTNILAKLTNKRARYLNLMIGDAHVYESHLDSIKTQLSRIPNKQFPIIKISDRIKHIDDAESWTFFDFKLIGYECDGAVRCGMIA